MSETIIELCGVSKRFGPTYDAAARLTRDIAARFGKPPKNETVYAVDRVDLVVQLPSWRRRCAWPSRPWR